MNSKVVNSNELFEQLKRLIDLPDEVVAMTIHIEAGQPAELDITKYCTPLENDFGGAPETETIMYKLIPVEE